MISIHNVQFMGYIMQNHISPKWTFWNIVEGILYVCIFSEARKNNYLVAAGVCVLCLRTAHQQCGAVAEGTTGGHCWGRCYHGEGLDSFCSSSVVPSLSSPLSITLSVSPFLLQPTRACLLTSPPVPLFPLLCHFCPLLSPRHSTPPSQFLVSFLFLFRL